MEWLTPNWPAANNIRALTTLRCGGYSRGAYQGLNLAAHVGDEPEAVQANRKLLSSTLNLPAEPLWLTQVHGTGVVLHPGAMNVPDLSPVEADASVSFGINEVCAVLTADCLPILLCDEEGTRISAIHAGWRGLAAGVVEAAVERLSCPADHLMAWLGPGIGPLAFEVGEEVVDIFTNPLDPRCPPLSMTAFKKTGPTTWQADLYLLASIRLQALGIVRIFGGEHCTYSDPERFYSARRSSKQSTLTGRMATLIWRTS